MQWFGLGDQVTVKRRQSVGGGEGHLEKEGRL